MRIAGVIAEYNPFHSGHAYHLARAREMTGCDFLVVCMDGSYTQRGEAACLSKWTRTELALRSGADAVVELPALFAVRTADAFALGGVATLDGLGVDVLSFGCESEDAELLNRFSCLREREPDGFAERMRPGLAEGMSHARAWGEAAAQLLGVPSETLNAPNMILGAEYLRAIRRLDSRMEIAPVRRKGGYHEVSPETDGFASATAVRRAFSEGRMEDVGIYVPEITARALRGSGGMHAPDDLLLERLRSMTPEAIAALPDVAEGLEHRVKRCADEADGFETLIGMLKCKRYTRARLVRLTAHALLGMTAGLTRAYPLPVYARLLGARADAGALLKELKRRARLPMVSDPTQLKENEIFRLECRATDLRALQCNAPDERRAGQEFKRKFVRV